jgi:hypothetical protein
MSSDEIYKEVLRILNNFLFKTIYMFILHIFIPFSNTCIFEMLTKLIDRFNYIKK